MKKLLLLLPILFLYSCASAPEKAVEPVVAAVVEPAQVFTADKEKTRATEAMNKAKSVKAEVAMKDEFNKALGIYNEANTLVSAGGEKVKTAAAKYLESEALFLAVYEKSKIKREEAVKQLEKAKAAVKNVEEDAAELEAEMDSDAAATGGGS
ncbi:MAG: hypothetical protein RBT69_03590 [Spirochaetia bacterium]|jgi:hypothetical protein|nr:hypothetical protein [Spirochaetia bacterium]